MAPLGAAMRVMALIHLTMATMVTLVPGANALGRKCDFAGARGNKQTLIILLLSLRPGLLQERRSEAVRVPGS